MAFRASGVIGPSGPVSINYGDPLMRAISMFVTFHDYIGVELVRRAPIVYTSSSGGRNGTYGKGRYGNGANSVASNTITRNKTSLVSAGGGYTWRLLFSPLTWPGEFTAGWDDSARVMAVFFNTSGVRSFSSLLGVTSFGTLTGGGTYDIILTCNPGNTAHRLYVNGDAVTTGGALNVDTNATLDLGGNPSTGADAAANSLFWIFQEWGRQLSHDEVFRLGVDPWAGTGVFNIVRNRRFGAITAAGGSPEFTKQLALLGVG